MSTTNPFRDRLRKRRRHLSRWARRWPTDAWRAYDRDMPEFPFAVDVYGPRVLVQEFRARTDEDEAARRRDLVLEGVAEVFEVAADEIAYKTRFRRTGGVQYERLDTRRDAFLVSEGGLRFEVNLTDYIDTGLFLDHRAMRRIVGERVASWGKRRVRVLNLFAYTGAFSVWAARAGAHVTTFDMSNTYLAWAQRNFEHNDLDPNQHVFVRADVTTRLEREVTLGRTYDLIVIDPPTFSRSKKMERDFDIQRDHKSLLTTALSLLAPGGEVYFSTNLRTFTLDAELAAGAHEITNRTTSEDFRLKLHRAWLLRG